MNPNRLLAALELSMLINHEQLLADHRFEPSVLIGVENAESAVDNLYRFLDVEPPQRDDIVDWPIAVTKSGVELMEEGL